ncbi:MAG: hypothetical protein AB7Q29_04420 [Vicinamibacterales bacterium]
MSDLLAWIQGSALGQFVRESGPWTYPVINLAHILGIATLFGAVLVLDFALIGAAVGEGGTDPVDIGKDAGRARHRGAAPAVIHAAAPIAGGGFLLAAATGIGLLSANATEYQGNVFFLIKLPAIALGALNALLVRRTAAWRALGARDLAPAETKRLAWMGAVSLVSWTTAIAAGRLIAYW